MPHSDYTTEVCRNCRVASNNTPCWLILHEDEPSDCPYRMAREGRTLPPVPSSVDQCTEMYPDIDDVPSELCERCGLNRGVNAKCCHSPALKPEQKICFTCGHNYDKDGKIKPCGQMQCTWNGREEGWIPYVINEPTPVIVTASRFYTPTVEDEMKEIKPVVGWEE